jgi:protein-L-isoaspartate(D-aspartate) O-methyltransferase
MVRTQMEARGITDPRVLSAMRRVPRHRFIPEAQHREAYADRPLPIGHGQTISQPYIVAFMSELARIEPGEKVLEIGTGSGYQAAILAAMGARVWSIEIVEPLARGAARLLAELGWGDVQVRHGDGYLGWPEHAPFDAILLTAAPLKIPEPLREQLAVGGRLVAPVGRNLQQLVVMTRTPSGYEERIAAPVRFVPMTGAVETAG